MCLFVCVPAVKTPAVFQTQKISVNDPNKKSVAVLKIRRKQTILPKCLPRPNHYADDAHSEILCTTWPPFSSTLRANFFIEHLRKR